MIAKEQITFDPTNLGDTIGAYTLGSDGTAIDQTGGSLHVNVTSLTAADVDIRDLVFATDKVDVTGSSVTVSATDLDIRDLSAATDSVAAWTHDGTGNAITSTTGHLDVNIASSDIEIDVEDDKANTVAASTAKNVTDVSAALITAASQLAARRFFYVQNLGNDEIYLGASGVTTANGIRLSRGSIGEFRMGPALELHAVASAGKSVDTRMLELS